MTIAVLGAQRHQTDGYNNHNRNTNNHSYQNDVRQFHGFLVVNERDIRNDARLGFHINLNNMQFTHIDFMAGTPRSNSYGILVQKHGGGYAYYRLDKKGRRIARNMLARNRNDNKRVYVQVTGKLIYSNRTIAVRSMERVRGNRNNGPCGNDDYGHHWG
jgi:hypothetical protein